MFGALNRFISRLDADPQGQSSGTTDAFGFQVLKNGNSELAIEPWFDFIIGINGRNLDSGDPNLFSTEIRNCAGNTVSLGIWSAKGQRIRSQYVPVPADNASLGLSLQWSPLNISEEVWHILDVTPESPADKAGLLPFGDYVLGSPDYYPMRGESGLGEVAEKFLDNELRLWVFNHEYNVVREVTIQPSRIWGGQGALGCSIGFGKLHLTPAPLDEPPQAPGETLFETARLSTDGEARPSSALGSHQGPSQGAPTSQFVPAASTPPPPKGGPPKSAAGKKARPHHGGNTADMDAYFQEGEEKSREVDGAPTKAGGGSLPPPPKAGSGPPKTASKEEAAE